MAKAVNTKDGADIYQVDVSLPSGDLVYGLINHDCPPGEGEQTLTPELMVLGTPQINQGAYNRDTQISATATALLTEMDDYQGTAMLYYDRLNLGSYLRNVSPILIDAPEATTSREIWPIIKDMFGLGLTAVEIKSEELNWDTVNGQLISILPDNLAWQGSVRILMKPRIPNLNDIVMRKQLDGLTFLGIGNKANGEVYSYGRDTTDYVDYLSMIPTGTMISDIAVADALSEMTGDSWKLEGSNLPFNLYGARVAFNGELGDTIPSRAGFTCGIEITLDENYCSSVGGPLVFYYKLEEGAELGHLRGKSAKSQNELTDED